jgi:hypothetical protein
MLTNDIAALEGGRGCYAAYLTPQGRMIADMRVIDLGDVLLLDLPAVAKDTVLARLDQFVFVCRVFGFRAGLCRRGPRRGTRVGCPRPCQLPGVRQCPRGPRRGAAHSRGDP